MIPARTVMVMETITIEIVFLLFPAQYPQAIGATNRKNIRPRKVGIIFPKIEIASQTMIPKHIHLKSFIFATSLTPLSIHNNQI
jgi:hypothetical protein